MQWILWLYLINTIVMLIIAVREVRRPAKALNWLAICLILPIVGFVFYISTVNPKRIHKERLSFSSDNPCELHSFSPSASRIAYALQKLSVNGLHSAKIQVLTNGIETYKHIFESLKNAQKTIDLEYYIYRDDQIGKRITELLIERAEAGVQVRFIRDGWGSRKFPRSEIKRMMNVGIECRTIFPLRFPWITSNWNYRDHCKIITIDKKEAFTGGINIGYEYTGLKPDVGFWRDTHVHISGEASADLQRIFDSHWNIAEVEKSKIRDTQTGGTKNKISSGKSLEWTTEMSTEFHIKEIDTESPTKTQQEVYVHTLEGNPGIPTPVIREAYFICITQAVKTIDITTPYFIPDEDIIMAIKTAALRGVRVRLLVPQRVDQIVVGTASRTYYGELLEAGVNIFLYEKGMLHAKQMVIDGEIVEIGAANYDMRSFRLNYETCQFYYSKDVAKKLTVQFERDLSESKELTIEDVKQRSFSKRLVEQSARLLSPLL
ncbi:phospholipase D-like domain-containing protein [Thalassobacillus devorans]|uniref:phospholipase D-like domain-containing protein n=1 Tax=Thalassobacillus devorans TaxID=279813 RepID=UPI000A1C8B5D|nr:phospholipase D-like domain-containing protein [Thalassobacillus devorans]